jgi:hypothetical protein
LGVHGGSRGNGSGGRRGCLVLDTEVSNGGSCEIQFNVWLLGFDICQGVKLDYQFLCYCGLYSLLVMHLALH